MKWGVRKEDSSSSSKSSASPKKHFNLTKKQVVIGASVVVGVAAAAIILANHGKIKSSLLNTTYGKRTTAGKRAVEEFMEDHGHRTDFALPKGQEFSRISKMAESDIREATYASFKPKDVANYKAFWGNEKARHQILIKAAEETKFASPKTQLDVLSTIVDRKLTTEYGGKSIRQILRKQESTLSGKLYVSLADKTVLAKDFHRRLDVSGWRKGPGLALINELKKQGYSGALDSVDSGGISDTPVILFKSAVYNLVSSKKLNPEDIQTAYEMTKSALSG